MRPLWGLEVAASTGRRIGSALGSPIRDNSSARVHGRRRSVVGRTVFAIAGDANNAATPTANRITFGFDLMFNLMWFAGFHLPPILRTNPRRTSHQLITKLCGNIVFTEI